MSLKNVVNAETGEPIEAYTTDLLGVNVIIHTEEGIITDWIDETYCPVCEAHFIGPGVFIGGCLARHDFLHKFHDSYRNAGITQ